MQNKEYFNDWAEKYDDDILWGHYFKYCYKQIIQIVKEKDIKFYQIIDLGCGTGELERQLFFQFPHITITAVDLSDKMINIASSKIKNKNIKFIIDDVNNLHFFENSFDAIFVLNNLHHFYNLEMFFQRINPWLKSNGYLFIIDPFKDSFIKAVWCFFLKYLFFREKNVHYHKTKELVFKIQNLKYSLIKLNSIYYFSSFLIFRKN